MSCCQSIQIVLPEGARIKGGLDLPDRDARCLNELFVDHQVFALHQKFPANTPDVWINTLNHEGGWAVLTKDLRIRTRPHERAELDNSRIIYFFLSGGWRKITVEESLLGSSD